MFGEASVPTVNDWPSVKKNYRSSQIVQLFLNVTEPKWPNKANLHQGLIFLGLFPWDQVKIAEITIISIKNYFRKFVHVCKLWRLQLNSICFLNKTPAYHRDILRPLTLLKMPSSTMEAYILEKSFIKFSVFRKISVFLRNLNRGGKRWFRKILQQMCHLY